MKKFSCHIITIILLAGCVSLFQSSASATDVEIHGQIGKNETIVQSSSEPESDSDSKLAQPKQTSIGLRRLPNNGSTNENLTLIGLLLLLMYLLLTRWKAHRSKRVG